MSADILEIEVLEGDDETGAFRVAEAVSREHVTLLHFWSASSQELGGLVEVLDQVQDGTGVKAHAILIGGKDEVDRVTLDFRARYPGVRFLRVHDEAVARARLTLPATYVIQDDGSVVCRCEGEADSEDRRLLAGALSSTHDQCNRGPGVGSAPPRRGSAGAFIMSRQRWRKSRREQNSASPSAPVVTPSAPAASSSSPQEKSPRVQPDKKAHTAEGTSPP